MALEKTDISIDLVQGADTKVNPQIDTSFQEMVNVTFDGDMTAKKMKGYDLIATLPEDEKYSLIARRQNDLIAQSDQGTYRYIENFAEFQKISGMGSCVIESNEFTGFSFGFSTNYRCGAQAVGSSSGLYFYNHDGVLINKLAYVVDEYSTRFTKILAVADDFFVCSGNLILGVYTFNISKYSLDVTTNQFKRIVSRQVVLAADEFKALDFFADSTSIYAFYATASDRKYKSFNFGLVETLSVAMVTNPTRNIEIFQATDPLYLWVMTSVETGVNTSTLKLIKLRKSTFVETLVTNIVSRLATGDIGNYVFPIFMSYPTSDTTAVYVASTKFFISSIFGLVQNIPTGKIFLSNGRYYVPFLVNSGNNIATVVMSVEEQFTEISPGVFDSLGYYPDNPMAVCDSGQVAYNIALPNFSFMTFTANAPCVHDGKFFFPSVNPSMNAVMVSFDPDAKKINSSIEIDKRSVFSGGLLGYYDGITYAEHGFIGNPNPYNFSVLLTGALPADTGYQFVALYKYVDVAGNIFYSPPSQIYSGGDPVNGLTLAANSKVTILLQQSLITQKESFTLEIYIRRKNKPFQLCYENNQFPGQDGYAYSRGSIGFEIEIVNYPASTAKIYPYQDGSIATETTSNSSHISLYADRIFRISKDNPNSLAYSQRKLAGSGFEFNDSFFYLDVLDKRGIAEDELTGSIAMDGRLIIFKETSILYMNGAGPSRANTQDDFSEPQLVVSDVGCTEPRSIILVPDGVMFKSDKGIYLLNRKLQAGYVGSNVEQFNNYTIISSVLLEKTNEVRFATLEGLILVYNYLSMAWSWFTDFECISACLFDGKYTVLNNAGQVLIQNNTHNKLVNQAIVQKIASPWLRLNKIQGYQKAYCVRILGKYKSLHQLKMKVYYDYELYSSEEYIIDPLAENQYNIEIKPSNESIEDGSAINGVYQMKIDLIRKNCQAIRVTIEDVPLDTVINTGECFALSNITINIGLKKGLAKIQASESY